MVINISHPRSDLIGEQITVVPIRKSTERGSFTVYECERPDQLDEQWDVRLSNQQPVELHKPVDAHIYRVSRENNEIHVSADDFGMKELAQTHRNRFLAASKYVIQLPDYDNPSADELDHDTILNAREMLRFCIRRDEVDWFSVYHLLGKPSIDLLEDAYELMEGLRTSVRDGEDEAIGRYIINLSDLGILSWYNTFIERVEQGKQYQALPNKELLEKLYNLNPTEFEHFIADCWEEQGFTAEVTSQKDDLGIDIIAERQKPWREKHAIQVKRYHPDTTINLDEVRSYGTIDKMGGADKGFIITTSRFTANAREAAESIDIELIDGTELTEFIDDEDLHKVVSKYVK
jgi:hypothetical protein